MCGTPGQHRRGVLPRRRGGPALCSEPQEGRRPARWRPGLASSGLRNCCQHCATMQLCHAGQAAAAEAAPASYSRLGSPAFIKRPMYIHRRTRQQPGPAQLTARSRTRHTARCPGSRSTQTCQSTVAGREGGQGQRRGERERGRCSARGESRLTGRPHPSSCTLCPPHPHPWARRCSVAPCGCRCPGPCVAGSGAVPGR